MAKEKTAKEKMHATEKAFLEGIGSVICDKMDDVIFEVEGSPMAIVKKADGGFSKKNLFGGWQFFLTSAYIGQRDTLILCLTPVETQAFETIELSPSEADAAFPLMGGLIGAEFGVTSESLPTVIGQINAQARLKIKKTEEESMTVYVNNPKFGMF